MTDERALLETASGLSPEKIYDQNCALAVLEKVLQRLRSEFVDQLFEDAYRGRCLLVGFNLPFDLSRIARSFGTARAAKRKRSSVATSRTRRIT